MKHNVNTKTFWVGTNSINTISRSSFLVEVTFFGEVLFGGPRVLGWTGLGGQGSWAGPAWDWLGGPRVLGRTGLGLAWGAKGPGPDRLGFGLGGQGSWAGPAWFLIL